MDDRDQQRLEELIHRELKQLPELPAPETLFHRVMLAVHVRERRPWWKRSILHWPQLAQLVCLALLLGCAGLVFYFVATVSLGIDVGELWLRTREWVRSAIPGWETLRTLAGAGALFFRTTGRQFLILGSAIVLTVYFLSVALTTSCYRLASSKL